MPILELRFVCDASESDALESACFEAGAISVGLFDAADAPILEPAPGTTPLWPTVRIVAQFPESADPQALASAIERSCGRAPRAPRITTVADRAWEREWLQHFRPMRFGARLWVCPEGQPAPAADAVIVRLDPGLAFGTGTHPTTAMCLEWLDGAQLLHQHVVDYGCGSGILAIASLRLGAHSATAVDIDAQALTATRDNARRNGVADRLDVLPAAEPVPLADVLLANILAEPLIELAPRFGVLVRRGGRLLIGGIIGAQRRAVALACEPWFDMRPFASRDEWVCLEGVRR